MVVEDHHHDACSCAPGTCDSIYWDLPVLCRYYWWCCWLVCYWLCQPSHDLGYLLLIPHWRWFITDDIVYWCVDVMAVRQDPDIALLLLLVFPLLRGFPIVYYWTLLLPLPCPAHLTYTPFIIIIVVLIYIILFYLPIVITQTLPLNGRLDQPLVELPIIITPLLVVVLLLSLLDGDTLLFIITQYWYWWTTCGTPTIPLLGPVITVIGRWLQLLLPVVYSPIVLWKIVYPDDGVPRPPRYPRRKDSCWWPIDGFIWCWLLVTHDCWFGIVVKLYYSITLVNVWWLIVLHTTTPPFPVVPVWFVELNYSPPGDMTVGFSCCWPDLVMRPCVIGWWFSGHLFGFLTTQALGTLPQPFPVVASGPDPSYPWNTLFLPIYYPNYLGIVGGRVPHTFGLVGRNLLIGPYSQFCNSHLLFITTLLTCCWYHTRDLVLFPHCWRWQTGHLTLPQFPLIDYLTYLFPLPPNHGHCRTWPYAPLFVPGYLTYAAGLHWPSRPFDVAMIPTDIVWWLYRTFTWQTTTFTGAPLPFVSCYDYGDFFHAICWDRRTDGLLFTDGETPVCAIGYCVLCDPGPYYSQLLLDLIVGVIVEPVTSHYTLPEPRPQTFGIIIVILLVQFPVVIGDWTYYSIDLVLLLTVDCDSLFPQCLVIVVVIPYWADYWRPHLTNTTLSTLPNYLYISSHITTPPQFITDIDGWDATWTRRLLVLKFRRWPDRDNPTPYYYSTGRGCGSLPPWLPGPPDLVCQLWWLVLPQSPHPTPTVTWTFPDVYWYLTSVTLLLIASGPSMHWRAGKGGPSPTCVTLLLIVGCVVIVDRTDIQTPGNLDSPLPDIDSSYCQRQFGQLLWCQLIPSGVGPPSHGQALPLQCPHPQFIVLPQALLTDWCCCCFFWCWPDIIVEPPPHCYIVGWTTPPLTWPVVVGGPDCYHGYCIDTSIGTLPCTLLCWLIVVVGYCCWFPFHLDITPLPHGVPSPLLLYYPNCCCLLIVDGDYVVDLFTIYYFGSPLWKFTHSTTHGCYLLLSSFPLLVLFPIG